MKLVLFSDLHLDAPFAWLGEAREAARRRRQALRDTLIRIVDLVSRTGVDALLCAGDLYEHDRVSPDTARFLQTTFASLHPVPVFLAPGNHDWYGPASLYHQVAWSPNVHLWRSPRLEPVSLADGLTLWGAAHCAPAKTDGFLDHFRVDRAGVHLALFHGSERGWLKEQGDGKTAHAPFHAEQVEQAGLDFAFVGHYHRPRDTRWYCYPGNPDPLTFGEDGERAAVLATVAGNGAVSLTRHPVAVSRVHECALDLSGCASQQDVRHLLAEQLAGFSGAVRVTLHGEVARELDLQPRDLAGAAPWLDALVVRLGDLRPAYDLEAIREEPTVRGQFVRDVLAARELDEAERRRVLLTGLRALEDRADLEVL